MRKAVLVPVGVVALILGSVVSAEASSTVIHASPASSTVGQQVTFTASLTSSCAGTVSTHYFTIDGKVSQGVFVQTGRTATETLTIATLTAGSHALTYNWKVGGTICRGVAYLTYAVAAPPPPPPSPTASPTSAASHSPSPSAAPVLTGDTKGSTDTPLGYFGGALVLLTVVCGIALLALTRRGY